MTKSRDALPSTPTVQVIERMFNLLEVLASKAESVSLKEISEITGLHPSTAHRILNDLTILWTAPKRAATAWACACWSWAIWSRPD
jgi:IclR helix-turn-helix domain